MIGAHPRAAGAKVLGATAMPLSVWSANIRKVLPIRSWALACALALAPFLSSSAAWAEDPVVGTWVGTLTQAGQDPFPTRLTFISPKGGVSRYPSFPCGGTLVGGRKGDSYVYQETVTWGGVDEQGTCINGIVRISIDGDTMKYDWSVNYQGQDYEAVGDLHREKR